MASFILTLNAGSSSLKFSLFNEVELAHGQMEGLGAKPHFVAKSETQAANRDQTWSEEDAPQNHEQALQVILNWFEESFPGTEIAAVGHRVVHGGPEYAAPIILNDEILGKLTKYEPLAPLHQPHNLAGIRAAQAAFPNAVQVACFDTAFHRVHPWVNDTFALPRKYYDEGVRRYGFHGLSYEYVSKKLHEIAPEHSDDRTVIAHLGNGASMCAIRNGQSVGSTMGFSALDGLPMGTRCGQIDPGVLLYMMSEHNMDVDDLTKLLYKESGLKGLSGISQDMREIEAADTEQAREAIDYYVFRIRRELGAMAAILGGIDSLVFCGGIGENSASIRNKVCESFDWMGLELDFNKNSAGEVLISTETSKCKIYAIKTDEEAMIAAHTAELLHAS